MVNWTPEKIRDYYDSNPDITLAQLARITGLTVAELKKVLMALPESYAGKHWPGK